MNKQINLPLILILILSCSENGAIIIFNPTAQPSQNYKMNLQSNSGQKLNSVKISWNDSGNDVSFINLSTENPVDQSGQITELTPGDFLDIEVSTTKDDIPYKDTIQVFTRPVYPVYNFRYEVEMVMRGNGDYDFGESYTDLDTNNTWNEGEVFIDIKNPKYHRVLNWSPTIEPDESFSNYVIYRVKNINADELINPEICECEIVTLTKTDTSFTDSMVTEESGIYAYFYQIRVIAGGSGQNSYIYNYTNFTSPGKISLTNSNVSKNNNEFIQIMWEPVSNSTYFYQYEIWRSSKENSENPQRLAVITNSEQGKFMDRNVGNGTTWYYSVAVVDINGQRKYSDYISGWSNP